MDVLYVYCFKSVGSYKHKLSRIESLVILYWGINCILIHFYCLAVEAGFYSNVVECLPVVNLATSWGRQNIFSLRQWRPTWPLKRSGSGCFPFLSGTYHSRGSEARRATSNNRIHGRESSFIY